MLPTGASSQGHFLGAPPVPTVGIPVKFHLLQRMNLHGCGTSAGNKVTKQAIFPLDLRFSAMMSREERK